MIVSGNELDEPKLDKPKRKFKFKLGKFRAPKFIKSRRFQYGLILIVIILTIAGFLSFNFVVSPALQIKADVDLLQADFEVIKGDFEKKDLTKLPEQIDKIQSKVSDIDKKLDQFSYLESIGFTKPYYDNLQAGRRIVRQIDTIADTALPKILPLLNAAGYLTEVGQKPDDKKKDDKELATIVSKLPALVELYEEIEPQLLDIVANVRMIDPNYVPAIGKYDFKDELISVQELIKDFPTQSEEFKKLFRVTPDLLGVKKTARYLVLFINEKEMRSAGGIYTAYGNIQVKNGEIVGDISATDMWDLQYDLSDYGLLPPIQNKNGQLTLMVSYGFRCGGYNTRVQDSGVFADMQQNISRFREYYDKAMRHNILKRKYPTYDHIITINTYPISRLVRFVEPIKIKELNLTIDSSNLARSITKYLNTDSSRQVGKDNRKGFIKYLAEGIEEKVNSLSAADLPNIARVMMEEIQSRHIAMYSSNSDIQTYFKENGLTGQTIKPNDYKDGDYFMQSEAQYCGLKSNFHVRNTVDMLVNINSKGEIKKRASVIWENKAYAEETPAFIIDPSGRYPYAVWSRLIVPTGSVIGASDGYQKSGKFFYQPKSYYDGDFKGQVLDHVVLFKQVRKKGEPVKTERYSTNYTLPSNIKYRSDRGYRQLILKHPGKNREQFIINIEHSGVGKGKTEFTLTRDQIVTWKDGQITVENLPHPLDEKIVWMEELTKLLKK